MWQRLQNIFWLGTKELRSLQRDLVLVIFVIYSFSLAVYVQAVGTSSEVNNASIAFVDEDRSMLSARIVNAFYPPNFQRAELIQADEVDQAIDRGRFMFVVAIPPNFEADVRDGRTPEIQVNIDATAMMQASIGANYIQNIATDEITRFIRRSDRAPPRAVEVVIRTAFNPNRTNTWFSSFIAIIDSVTLLTIVLTGAALLREREHGTIEHLLVMPLDSFEIVVAKVWANALVILVAVMLCLIFVVRMLLQIPIAGSIPLFLAGTALYLFFATAVGVFLGTVARSMAQFALLTILVMLPLNMLSGGRTPAEGQPDWLQYITMFLPSRHFVAFSQAIIYRGAGIDIVWPEFAIVAALGLAFFATSLFLFRRSVSVTQ
jgi:ABC-2 type transport system permease protein